MFKICVILEYVRIYEMKLFLWIMGTECREIYYDGDKTTYRAF